MAQTEEKPSGSVSLGPTEKECLASKNVLSGLLLAWKNYFLYPENHANCRASFERFQLQLEDFLKTHDSLRFEFTKEEVLFEGEVIHVEPPEEGNLLFTLFRDGIQWLEFQKGIEPAEIREFLRILNECRILKDEPEGDLVTALWTNPLCHIRYQVVDFFWGAEPETNFSVEPEEAVSETFTGQEQSPLDLNIAPLIDPAALTITAEEEEKLQALVLYEEKRDPLPDYLEALTDCLLQHKQIENFVAILESLEDEFRESLVRRDFAFAQKILKNLRYVISYSGVRIAWVRPIIENFMLTVCSIKNLRSLQATWSDLNTEQVMKLKEVLRLFQPEAIHALALIMNETPSFRIQQMLLDVIVFLASRDIGPLKKLLNSPDEALVQKLVNVLGRLEGEKASGILSGMARHASPLVRREAIKEVLRHNPQRIQEFFYLIEDENESVRLIILDYLGQGKSEISENLLLSYLEKGAFKRFTETHVIECFKALGRCGSTRSIPFLQRTLYGHGWLSALRTSINQQGAAVALHAMRTKMANQVLEDAGRSLYPGVRYAARKVLQGQEAIEKE